MLGSFFNKGWRMWHDNPRIYWLSKRGIPKTKQSVEKQKKLLETKKE